MKNVSNLDSAVFGTRKACVVTCLHTNKDCMALWYILLVKSLHAAGH